MPGFKESSILFSLQGLMDREKDRLDQEQAERLHMIEQTNQVRLDRERRQRDEEEQRLRAAHERALRDETLRREHQARMDAMKRAEIERVHLEAESRSRVETMVLQQEHERRMASIVLESRVRRFRALGVGGVVMSVAITACAGALYFGKLRPEAARVESAYSQLVAAQQARGDDAERLVEKQKKQNDKLVADLASARSALADARHTIDGLTATRLVHAGGQVATGPKRDDRGAKPDCDPDSRDPLNGCLR